MFFASEDNLSKAFPPSDSREILGWIWKMPDEKSDRLVVALGKAIKAGTIKNEEAMSLAWKVNRYCKCERYLIIHIQTGRGRTRW